MSGEVSVVAVVVTWNRRELLEECLVALREQTHALAGIVVVDNASTDETATFLASPSNDDLDVISLTTNTGGAGGFAAGVDRAMTAHPDLVWLLDDDTVPTSTALAELVRAWVDYPGSRPAILASRVVWTDGRDHPMNTPRKRPGASRAVKARAASVGAIPIRSASFVSIACDAHAIQDLGQPIADYFLWNDDFEYSTRLLRDRPGLHVPNSVVVHKTRVFGSTDVDPGERFFFEVRNKVWMFRRASGLRWSEKALYGASTARRWVRTYRGSSDRATLRRAALRGWRDGLSSTPRSNATVLAEAGLGCPESEVGPQPFSLLMSTWARDEPDQLRAAFESSVQAQTRRPDEVVLVQDGPVPEVLAHAIAAIIASSPVPVNLVRLEKNVGLGPALDAGLAACAHEIVARMDTDDVSVPERFARQVPLVEEGVDIVGSGLFEFGENIDDVVGIRTPPIDADEIRRVIKFRDPFNHPTVVYRRTAVMRAGGYADLPLLEDYLLFTRMVVGGAVPANIVEPLVYYRVGEGSYARRGGVRLLRSELMLQRRLRRLEITSGPEFARNVAVRGGYRLVPEAVRRLAYRKLLANRPDRIQT